MPDFHSRRRSRLHKGIRIPSFLSFKNASFWSRVTRLMLYAFIAGVVIVPLLFLWYSRDLPTPGKLVTSKYKDATRIYDRNGELLYSVYQDENRTYVKINEIPKYVKQGTIAIEDKDFYKNNGFSIIGIFRAFARSLLSARIAGGGSTITQQLVKNVLLTSEKSLPRKIKELMLSIQVDNRFSKDQILEMYLNNIPYGGTAIGVEAAAEQYFGKKAKELNLAESAFLAGLPQLPSLYTPFSGNKYYIDRTDSVLKRMVADKYITKAQAEKALTEIKNYQFTQRAANLKAAHFVMYVRQLLGDKFGDQMVQNGGLQVTTTLDIKMQEKAEEIVKDEIDSLKKYKVSNGAALISEPKTGEILAMVGSKDYFSEDIDGNFNVVTQADRQPGSSMKPIIYAKALEKGYTASTMLMDTKTEFVTDGSSEPYNPVNYDGKFRGPVQMRFALGNSLNIPAVKMLALVGIKDSMQLAYDMGVASWEPTDENLKNVGLSLVLGGRETHMIDEVTAYGVFANGGVRQDPVAILKVTDSRGHKLFEYKPREGKRVLPEEVAYIISHILLDNNARADEFGTNSYLRIPGRTVAAKTGTTDEKRDNWTFGYTPSLVVGVWVGNNDYTPMNQAIASGATGASPIWHNLMVMALKGKPDEDFKKPENVIALQIDPLGGGLPRDGQPARSEFFIKGTEPTSSSSIYQNKDGKDYWVFTERDPVSTDGRNRWQEGIDAWIAEFHKDEERYNPPGELKNKNSESPTSTPTP
ncbi:MAG: penicillin-binding protein [Candidatus Levybacteria bacterium]|nr:penicillin-binding protein [Candidatus Levybacteria bacterium]